MKKKVPLLVLIGPTAVGKTKTSIELAKALNGEIISADSMQIYKYMDIGTAKIKKEEMEGISHYLIDHVRPNEEFSVSNFQNAAKEYIDDINSKGKLPIVVGGTGLYINSLVYELDFTKAVCNEELRREYEGKAKKYGNEYIHNLLSKVDPKSALRIHKNDTKRIVRALEVFNETGEPMSKYYNNFRKHNSQYNVAMIGLTMDRRTLYDRINMRVDLMINDGLIEEVKSLLNMGFDKELTSLQGLGYKEIIKYLDGDFTLDEAIETLKRDTRRFAKRQLTWFKRDKRIHWIKVDDYSDENEIPEDIVKIVREKINFNEFK